MQSTTLHRLVAAAAALSAGLTLVGSATAVESPPSGIPPSEFATQYSGCLGQLRSMIAQGDFAGVGPFGQPSPGSSTPAPTRAPSARRSSSRS